MLFIHLLGEVTLAYSCCPWALGKSLHPCPERCTYRCPNIFAMCAPAAVGVSHSVEHIIIETTPKDTAGPDPVIIGPSAPEIGTNQSSLGTLF